MDVSSNIIARAAAELQPTRTKHPRLGEPNEWAPILKFMSQAPLDAAPVYGALQLFLECLRSETSIPIGIHRTGLFHVLRGWATCIADRTTTIEQDDFVSSLVITAQRRPEKIQLTPGVGSLFIECIDIFSNRVLVDIEHCGFAIVMLLNFAWPCLDAIARHLSRATHRGSQVGLWLARVLAPDDERYVLNRKNSTFPLVCPQFPVNGTTWLPYNTHVAKKLISPALLRHLVKATQITLPRLGPICNETLDRLYIYDSSVQRRLGDILTYATTPSSERASNYWSDELVY